jgi:hypothetical protein
MKETRNNEERRSSKEKGVDIIHEKNTTFIVPIEK